MKQRTGYFFLPILFLIVLSGSLTAQVNRLTLRHFLESTPPNSVSENLPAIRRFYETMDYSPVWITATGEKNRNELLDILKRSSREGLDEKDYQYEFISSIRSGEMHLENNTDSIRADIFISEAALHFFRDITAGNQKPALGFFGLEYSPSAIDIPLLLAAYCRSRQLSALSAAVQPGQEEIRPILQKLRLIEDRLTGSAFKEEKITASTISHLNVPLLKKLYYLGIADSLIKKNTDSSIRNNVIEVQKQFNLLADGVLRSTTLKELNVPIVVRVRQLKMAVNYYRWLSCITQTETAVVVNIPAAYMKVYDSAGVKLQMRMVVGKPYTPTPTLCSRISEVILYPYWHVPFSIATKELLPSIKKNPGFINTNNFQVINKQGKIMDPYKIDWKEINRDNFPYIIRQSTGCDNALGMIKLNFLSPFGVYLHDTPLKNMFSLNKRYFSHGCMRMEKPLELGRLILKSNSSAIDSLEEKGCVINQKPVIIPAEEKLPVIVWYNPVGIDLEKRVQFYEDVYRKFE